jgi:hypothetical protein
MTIDTVAVTNYSELNRLTEAANAVTGDVRVEMTIASESGPNQSEIDAVTAFMGMATPVVVLALIAENKGLAEEVELDNKIIAERDRLLNAIPECAAHGQCVPYAIQWAKDIQAEAKELLEERDQLKAVNTRLIEQVKVLQSDANSWQSGYDEGRRMGTKTLLETRVMDIRLAGFWRSPKEMPSEGAQVVVLRDAGHVGNGEHSGHRTGRWLELTTASRQVFVCDMFSTGNVIGWVGVAEFQRLEAMQAENEALTPSCEEIDRICKALSWLGVSVPSGGEERAARWTELVSGLVKAAEQSKMLRQDAGAIGALRKEAEFNQQVQRAAGELPEGWEIQICIEQGAGTVGLYHDGDQTEFESDGETLADQVEDAIETAKQEAF